MRIKLIFLLFCALLISSCGGRVPSQLTTSSIAKKHFGKYGHQYPQSVFGQKNISNIEVKAVEEIQKNVATSFLVLKFDNSEEIPVIMTMIRKLPLGWRISGWEKVTPP